MCLIWWWLVLCGEFNQSHGLAFIGAQGGDATAASRVYALSESQVDSTVSAAAQTATANVHFVTRGDAGVVTANLDDERGPKVEPPVVKQMHQAARAGPVRAAAQEHTPVRLAAHAATAEEAAEAGAAEGPDGSPGIYVDPTPADLEALLEAVAQLPLQLYELESDSVRGRLRFGAAGTDLEALVPGAVRMGRRAFPDLDNPGRRPAFVENHAHVDDGVLFMHGVGAAQALAVRQGALVARVAALEARANATGARFAACARRLGSFYGGGGPGGGSGRCGAGAGARQAARPRPAVCRRGTP
mmetsp:Transcript_21472/g.64228  ORF Transcript_21472/g.64228 Transcript_21472/m.64228 type:complete len:301 (-) Transcript_21472:2454-3356(-)